MPVINTNTAANSAIRYLNQNATDAAKSVAKLSSASRIVTASDDAAGLAISTSLQADLTTLKQAGINASQGASILQIADGGLARIADTLQRLKALSVQSNSGAVTNAERAYINAEYQQLDDEIQDIIETTTFNGKVLINQDVGKFVVGIDSTDIISADLSGAYAGAVSSYAADYGVAVTDLATAQDAYDTAVAGGVTATITTAQGDLDTAETALAAFTLISETTGDVSTESGATTASKLVDRQLENVSNQRSTIGALISRFDTRGQNIATTIENTQAANSTILDVDIASEQTTLTTANVRVQAAVSALSQANELPQQLLRILE